MRAAATITAVAISLVLASCASVDGLSLDLDGTTLHRFDGEPLRKRDILARRPSAISVARALAQIDRSLREPWAENRSAAVVLEDAARLPDSDVRVAKSMWRLSEPVPRGLRRATFGEYGFYADASPNHMFVSSISPESLEDEVARMLRDHTDRSDKDLLLAGWRHHAPLISQRRSGYLAAAWRFDLGSARVAMVESLLGPHRRCHVLDAGREFVGGANVYSDGYALPEGLAMLVAPGEPSPVTQTIDALANTGRAPSSIQLEGGIVNVGLSAEDREFLEAALKGLLEGCCDVEFLPRGCTRVEATFDYLVGNAEARATLAFAQTARGWTLNKFIYEPAAAAVVGRDGAELDLISMLRKLESGSTVSGK